MPFNSQDIATIRLYFEGFASALANFLHLYRGELPACWGGIDKEKFGVLIYLANQGMVVRVVPRMGRDLVRIRSDVALDQLIGAKWEHPRIAAGNQAYASALLKHLAGGPEVGMAAQGNMLTFWPKDQGGSCLIVGPILYQGLSPAQVGSLQTLRTDRERTAAGLPGQIPPWVVSIIARRTGLEALNGLDPDPIIAAKGVSDIIGRVAGLLEENPVALYNRARTQLEAAVATLNRDNEKAIHKVVSAYPWILVDQVDFENFDSERSLIYRERVQAEGGRIVDVPREARPDFLYHRYDDRTLVVEIEAASKRLLTQGEEVGYLLPTAKTVAAQFQILNYKHIFSGPFGSQIRERLNKPDSWGFDYLLVVGSKTQSGFDPRSWSLLRETMYGHGVILRDWDFYLDRLRRLEDAATFQNGG